MSAPNSVLAIGLAGFKGMTASQMAEGAKIMAAECAKVGISFDSRFIHADFPDAEREDLLTTLRSNPWAVVQIGSGLRVDVEHTRLLEDVVEMILAEVRPPPKLAFPTRPDEMIETFQRLLGRRQDQES